MPRASRHYISGYVWHITHRCHKKEYLLKFARDRRRWIHWLFEAKKRYGLIVLNYNVTSNHIHLLVRDRGDENVIPKSIQLIAARSGQEFNNRKKREKRRFLGRPLSCHGCRNRKAFDSVSRLYRPQYGPGWCCETSIRVGV